MTEGDLNAGPRLKKSVPASSFRVQRDVTLVDAYRALREAAEWWAAHAYRIQEKQPRWVDEAKRLGAI